MPIAPAPACHALLPGLILLFLAGCAAPRLGEIGTPVGASHRASEETRAFLAQHELRAEYRSNPEALLDRLVAGEFDEASSFAIAELSSRAGDRARAVDPAAAAGYYLTTARLCAPFVTGTAELAPGAPREDYLALYNHASAQVAGLLHHGHHSTTSVRGPGGLSYSLTLHMDDEAFLDPVDFDELYLAEHLKMRKLERHTRKGIGAPLVLHQLGTPERMEADPFHPSTGVALPATAALRFSPTGREATVVLYDTSLREHARFGTSELTLAADFTAPLAAIDQRIPKIVPGILNLVRPERYVDKTGLYRLEPFRPGQVPVVYIHGLASSPETWFHAINDLQGDPELRGRFQPLVHYYPTGFPIVYNAGKLREKLAAFRKRHDPDRRLAAMDEEVLIGHSMGGILSNLQVRSSKPNGTAIPNDPAHTPDQQELARKLLIWDANPSIRRAIFIATPHRGAKIADWPIGQFFSGIIRYSFDVVTLQHLPIIGDVTGFAASLPTKRYDSIDAMSAKGPLKRVLDLPLSERVTFHSIIGNFWGTRDLEKSTDLAVEYWSSHLDDAASEKVVRAMHPYILEKPETLEEIRRLLHLHLE